MIDNLHDWAQAWQQFNDELDDEINHINPGPTPPVGPSQFDTIEEDRGER